MIYLHFFSFFSRFVPKHESPDFVTKSSEKLPDISWTINTNFSAMAAPDALSNNHDKNGAFNFEKFYKTKNGFQHKSEGKYDEIQQNPASVWAMDCEEGLIILGCANGRIEIWETMSCQFKVIIFLDFPCLFYTAKPFCECTPFCFIQFTFLAFLLNSTIRNTI